MLGVNPLLRLGIDTNDLRRGEIVHHVQVVGREVDHHTDVADSRRERSLPAGVKLIKAPGVATGDSAMQLAHRGIEPLDVADGKQPFRALRGRDDLPALLEVGCDRLLHEDVRAVLEAGDCRGTVEAGRHRDNHRVEPLAIEHLVPGDVSGDRLSLGNALDRLPVGVADCHQLGARQIAEHTQMIPAHGPQADETEPRHAAVATFRTASTILSSSASVNAGCTGRDSTCSAAASATGILTLS